MSPEEKQRQREISMAAEARAKAVIKPGDRIGCTKCPGTKRVFTFAGWDGDSMVSKSGIYDYSPEFVYSVNGAPVDFTKEPTNG